MEAAASDKHVSSPKVFAEAFDFAQKQMDFRFTVMTGWELYEKVNHRVGQKMKRSIGTIHDYAYTLIDERLAKISSDEDFTNRETFQHDFLGLMMAFHHQREHNLNREELRDACLSFLLAGR